MDNSTIKEYIKCAKDPFYFYNKGFYTMANGNKNQVKPTKNQLKILKSLHECDSVGIIKSRKVGATSAYALFVAWNLIFHFDRDVQLFSHSSNVSLGFILKVIDILDFHKDKLEEETIKYSRHSIKIGNGSRLRASSHTDTLRGSRPDVLIVEEASYVKKLDLLMKTTIASMSVMSNSKIILSSSMGGSNDSLFKEWYLKRRKHSKFITRRLILEKNNNEFHYENSDVLTFYS